MVRGLAEAAAPGGVKRLTSVLERNINMKSYAIILLLCGGSFAMGFAVATKRNHSSTTPAPAPLSEASKEEDQPAPSKPREITAPKPVPATTAVADGQPQPVVPPPAAPQLVTTKSNSPSLRRRPSYTGDYDTLVSAKATLQEKQAAWKQLREAGQLDQAIEALKQGAAQNPNSPEWQAELGQGELQKAGVLSKSGASVNEQGIMGMQADQSFDAALKIDPANWEAQFYKAVAMAHWPAELNKGGEVVQMLSRLIDQQEAQTPQPQFAQTYTVLGEQYARMGQPDYAQKTWQLGLQKFPSDPTLLKKGAGQ